MACCDRKPDIQLREVYTTPITCAYGGVRDEDGSSFWLAPRQFREEWWVGPQDARVTIEDLEVDEPEMPASPLHPSPESRSTNVVHDLSFNQNDFVAQGQHRLASNCSTAERRTLENPDYAQKCVSARSQKSARDNDAGDLDELPRKRQKLKEDGDLDPFVWNSQFFLAPLAPSPIILMMT